jgi:hypothetical protein
VRFALSEFGFDSIVHGGDGTLGTMTSNSGASPKGVGLGMDK